jgi:hypothetical protein
MPPPCADRARGADEVRLRLPSPATPPALALVLAEARARAAAWPPARFTLDCAAVTELSDRALSDLARLRGELRAGGSDLALVNCGPALRRAAGGPAFAALFGEPAVMHAGHAPRGPHPAFLRTFRAGA